MCALTQSRFLAGFVILLCLFFTPESRPDPLKVDEVRITFSNPTASDTESRKLIPFKAGQKLTQHELDEKIRELLTIDFIDDIQYKWKISAPNRRVLKIHVVESRFIRNVSIHGNYPFLEKEVRRVLPLQPGAPFKFGKIQLTMRTLDEFFEKNGYYHAHFEIKPQFHKTHDVVDIKVLIKKGPVYRIRNITITGNENLSTGRIRNVIRHFTHFKMKNLKKDLKRIKKIYADKGYIKARVKPDKITFDDKNKKVDIALSIRENRKLKLRITGKPVIPRDKIHDVLAFAERRSHDRYAIRIGKERLRRYYIKNGYPNVQISGKTKKTDQDVLVTYNIVAGKQVELSRIRFSGNKKFGGKKLQKQISSQKSRLFQKNPFNEKKLGKDHLLLNNFYKSEGHFDAEISRTEITPNRQGDHYTASFRINEGNNYPIGKIKFQSESKIRKSRLLKIAGIKQDKPWQAETIRQAQSMLLEHYQKLGYAYVTVNITTIPNRKTGQADLLIEIKRQKKVHIGSLAIKGLLQTEKKIVQRNLKIHEGEIFNYQKMLDAQFNLRQLGIFSGVRIKAIGFEEKKDRIDILVTVHERKTISVNMLAGFDNRNLGRAELNFTKRNLFGLAKQFSTRFIGGLKFDRAEMTFSSPRVFGASWNLANQYFYQYENAPQFNAHSYGSFVSTLKNFGPRWTIGIKEQITRTEVIASQSNTTLLGNALFDNTFNEFETFFIFDNRDNYSDPAKGFYILVKNELNTDVTSVRNNFNTSEFNVSHHRRFFGGFTINNTVRFGHTYKITSAPRIPVNKLFFLGGADTIRGFSEDGLNPAGGTVYLAYNGELHFKIANGIKLAGFFDTGLLENDINSIETNDLRESAGIGLRYFTPVGPLRLDWGTILDHRAGEPKSRIHFSFGYFF